jgi:hypothetical protein
MKVLIGSYEQLENYIKNQYYIKMEYLFGSTYNTELGVGRCVLDVIQAISPDALVYPFYVMELGTDDGFLSFEITYASPEMKHVAYRVGRKLI